MKYFFLCISCVQQNVIIGWKGGASCFKNQGENMYLSKEEPLLREILKSRTDAR